MGESIKKQGPTIFADADDRAENNRRDRP